MFLQVRRKHYRTRLIRKHLLWWHSGRCPGQSSMPMHLILKDSIAFLIRCDLKNNTTPSLDNRVAPDCQWLGFHQVWCSLHQQPKEFRRAWQSRAPLQIDAILVWLNICGMSTQRFSNILSKLVCCSRRAFIHYYKRYLIMLNSYANLVFLWETSEAVGYSDPFYFGRLYKTHGRHAGCSWQL